MKAKRVFTLVVMLMLMVFVFSLVACDKGEPEQEISTVDEKDEVTYGEWNEVKLPTLTSCGELKRTGSDEKEYKFTLPLLSSKDYKKEVVTQATCEAKGQTKYTILAVDKDYSFIIEEDSIGHDYGETIYTWAKDGSSCEAKRVCSHDKNHIERDQGIISSEVTTKPTCSKKGKTTYMAAFRQAWAKGQTLVLEDVKEDDDSHKYNTTYTWNKDFSICTAKRVCEYNSLHVLEVESNLVSYEVILAPTFEKKGTIKFTATFEDPNETCETTLEIPTLLDEGYTLVETTTAPTAFKLGQGKYNYTYEGVTYDFVSEVATKDLNYYFEDNYKSALNNYLRYDGYSQAQLDMIVRELEINKIGVHDKASLKKLVDDYNSKNTEPITFNIVDGNDKISKKLYDTIINSPYDIQIIAYREGKTLNLLKYNTIIFTNDAPMLKQDIDNAFLEIGYDNESILINDEMLLVLDNLEGNYIFFDMMHNLETKEKGELYSKDGKYLIDVPNYINNYTILEGVEYVLSGALESQAKSVTLPASVKYVGDYGLAYVDNIITSENSNLEYIGDFAFTQSKDVNFMHLNKIKHIGKKAFFDASLVNVQLDYVEFIGDEAFAATSEDHVETQIMLPTCLSKLGKNVFINRMSLGIYLESKPNKGWEEGWNNVTLDGSTKAKVYVFSKGFRSATILPIGVDGYWYYDLDYNMHKWE